MLRGLAAVVALATAAGIGFSGALAPLCIFRDARAADYPTRPVNLIVPYPPGGGVDAMARVIAEQLSSALGEQVVVDNRAGGSGLIGTSAVGTGGYLSAELFKAITGVEATIIPYKGTAPVMNDLLGNHVPIAFGVLPPALGNLQAGTLRAIAVLGPTRFSGLPDVPTADESGLPGFESVLHYGLLAPAGTPRPIIERLNAVLSALLKNAEVQQRILAEGGDPLTSTPEEYGRDIEREAAKWGTLVRRLNLKVE